MKSLEFNETSQETYFFGEYLTLNKITCSVEDYIVTTAKDILIKKISFSRSFTSIVLTYGPYCLTKTLTISPGSSARWIDNLHSTI